jgi:hypothetical protein
LRCYCFFDIFSDNNTTKMIFYILANLLKLNFFSQWTVVNKHSFTIILGTFVWSILWQFTRTYTGTNVVLRAIYSGFYYLVLADLYTFFMTSGSMYNDNIYNKNFHDINYYGTLEMQPIRPLYNNKPAPHNTMINEVKQEDIIVEQVANDVSLPANDDVSEVPDDVNENKKNDEVST